MKKTEKLFRELKKNQLVAIFTPKCVEECLTAYEVLHASGIIFEITLRSEFSLAGIRLVLEKHPDALVLAGTVMTSRQAGLAIEAGVSGIVSADYIPEVVDVCVEHDIMCIPGGLSDAGKQLVHKAKKYGCSLEELKTKYPYQWIYKLFPAITRESSYLDLPRLWRGPYKDLNVLYTGGITGENLSEVLNADPGGIFGASALARHIHEPELLEKEIHKWKTILQAGETRKEESPSIKEFPKGVTGGVVTFGEIMMRLSPPVGVRLQNARNFELNFGGAEANVAVSLAHFGLNTSFVTVLPDNDLGDNTVNTLKMHGVDTRFILRRGDRMGIYFLEHGSGPRPSNVIYDRANSAISTVTPEDFDWHEILDTVVWFHWTGISPALGDSVAETLKRALEIAKRKGITVSADLNYRKKLWTREKAGKVMCGLMPYVDILIANEEDPAAVFGIESVETDVEKGKLNIDGYRKVAEELIKRFGFKKVAITLRQSISASENKWSACLYDGENFYHSPEYHVWIVDRVGTGDAFAAGFIYGHLTGKTNAEALNFGVAASCLKHSLAGDFNLVNVTEVERLAAGETGGRVQR
ncbi:MAG: aldolase [Candidatus Aminicenantes bacterium]|nr:aldolase [Candidatus Aminicenantes bacterium]NIM83895.1 aldolase [Candidatus Aminicenantes bacterium]NIN23361.1 aldolase [Candidatus Aminicenantes bacterium]NIN47063.1 aldolase [Candidatus Aminicenantes bacterium]NIN89987.1 aldolase [Candidatus Aminicenantes bacterium]